jgi:predicted  nucleic acid-binding Zn-ribbon protein
MKFFNNFGTKVIKQSSPVNNNTNISTSEKFDELETELKKFKEQSIEIKKAMDELFKINDNLEKENNKLLSELESKLKNQVEEHNIRFDKVVKDKNNYIKEYSNFINEKLIEIVDLKNKLLKENKIVCYKIFGITIFKVTTNKRN